MKASWSSTNGPEGRVRGRPGLGDEVELAVRARGIAVERHELLDDDLAHLVEPYYLMVRGAPLPIEATGA